MGDGGMWRSRVLRHGHWTQGKGERRAQRENVMETLRNYDIRERCGNKRCMLEQMDRSILNRFTNMKTVNDKKLSSPYGI